MDALKRDLSLVHEISGSPAKYCSNVASWMSKLGGVSPRLMWMIELLTVAADCAKSK